MKAIVKFSFGVSHPLNNQPVEAEIKPCCGHDRMCIHATTVGRVFFPANPKGAVRFYKDGTSEFQTTPPRVEYVDGWVSEIFDEKKGEWVSAYSYCEYLTYLRLKEKYEKQSV